MTALVESFKILWEPHKLTNSGKQGVESTQFAVT